MSEKDTFQILADEITLIRGEIKQLQRSSLNKDEAKALNQQLVQGVDSMAQTGQAVYEAISERMDLRLEKLAIETILAAKDAASGAIAKNHAETIAAARDLSKAAGEARREAWRYFGGFWVWLASVGAGGAVLDILIWLIAALGAFGGVVLGRLWGRAEGKRVGKLERERDAMADENERTERGRKAVQVGRGSGDPAHRLHNNDARW